MGSVFLYDDRRHAARLLAQRLGPADIVCAIPRGGLELGAVIAEHLKIPLSIVAVKKVTAPAEPEFARGAASSECSEADPGTPEEWISAAKESARAIEDTLTTANLSGKHVILVDDGAATGRTFLIAIETARSRGAAKITAALPLASREAADAIREHADEVIILETPEPFFAVGSFYREFEQVSDDEAKALLDEHR